MIKRTIEFLKKKKGLKQIPPGKRQVFAAFTHHKDLDGWKVFRAFNSGYTGPKEHESKNKLVSNSYSNLIT